MYASPTAFFIHYSNTDIIMSFRKSLLIIFILFITSGNAFSSGKKNVNPGNALMRYIHNNDKTFGWEVIHSSKSDHLTTYQIVFTSQKWRGITWKHELFVMVPGKVSYTDALLFITGGHVKDGEPGLHKLNDELVTAMGQIAVRNEAITSVIFQVPNQPLYGGKTEDELISHTFYSFMNDGDYTWPLLFPMTKSAVRAMDVLQHFAKKEHKQKITHFLVSGASKRGWTTWLTGAADRRVKAIAPMVIDVLNMPVSIDYHKVTWGDYSIQIEDYVKLGIAQQMSSEAGRSLVRMVDPYSYRKQLTMPKMLFMGTNDEYWPVDAVKNYIDSIPGNNSICYVANAGHGLGDKKQALNTLSAFFANTLTGSPYPRCDYSLTEENNTIRLKVETTASQLKDARMWTSTSTDRDFRDEKWSSASLGISAKPEVTVELKYPQNGYKAFYVELLYQAPKGHEYTESTRIFLAGQSKVYLNINE